MITSGRLQIVHHAAVGNDGNGNRRADPGWSFADNVAWAQCRVDAQFGGDVGDQVPQRH